VGPRGEHQAFKVFCGVDVARETHHAVALDRGGRRLADRPLPNDEAALRTLFSDLAVYGPVLVVVDQPASIGALAIAVARSMGIEVGYLLDGRWPNATVGVCWSVLVGPYSVVG